MSERRLKGRYELSSVLGRGLATTTHLARDHETGERCVVKLLPLSAEDALKAHELLTREARVLQRLDHPRIPRLVDFFSEEDGPQTRVCLVQQHVEGRSLHDRVRAEGPLDEREALALGIKLCDVLEYLHGFEPPILHRDLKPANVLVTPAERVYLVDFGAVRDHLPHEMLHPSGPTIVGTRGFMPIEQFEGHAVPGSDLYALGTTLVFALSGKEPSELGKSGLRLAFEPHVAVSPGFARLLGRLLEPDWRDRPLAAREVRDELERLAEQARRPRPASRPARRRLLALAVLVAVAVAGIALLSTRGRRPPAAGEPVAVGALPGEAAAVADLAPAATLPPGWQPWKPARRDAAGDALPPGAIGRLGTVRLRHGGAVRALAVTPDGRTVVSAGEDATASLWDLASGEERSRLLLGARPEALAVSPDGTRLLVGESGHFSARLFSLPDGRPLARLVPASARREAQPAILGVAWSRDGRTCATRTEDAIDLWAHADGRHLRRLQGCGRGAGLAFVEQDRALVAACRDGFARVLDAASGAELRRLAGADAALPLAVSPDERLAAAARHGSVALFDFATGAAAGTIRDDQLDAASPAALAFAPDGRRLAVGLANGRVVLLDVVARARSQVLDPGGRVSTALAFAPDGRSLHVAAGPAVTGFDLARSPLAPAASAHLGAVADLDFSADGAALFSAGADGAVRRWERGGESRVVSALERAASAVATLSATRVVAVEEGRAHLYDVASGWEVTSLPLARSPRHRHGVAVAPAAGLLAVGDGAALHVVDVATGARRSFPVPRAEEPLAFSPDGRVLATLREEEEPLAGRPLVLRDAASGRELRQLAHARGGAGPFRCRSADGSYFGFGGVVYRLGGGATGSFDYLGTIGRVRVCAVSPDGRYVAVAHVDDPELIELRERVRTSSGPRSELPARRDLRGHRGPVTALVFAPDSRTLASGGDDTTILLWDALAPAPAAPLARQPARRAPIVRLSFDGDGIADAGATPLRLGPDAPLSLGPGFRGRALAPSIGLAFPELRETPLGEAFTLLAAFRLDAAGLEPGQPQVLVASPLASLQVHEGGRAWLFLHFPRGGHTQVDLAAWLGTVAPGRWYRVALAVERRSGAVRVCVDGVCGPGPSWQPIPDRVGELRLAPNATWQPFAGALDELALYDRALGDDEMAQAAGLARAVPLPSPTPRPTPTPLPRLPVEQELPPPLEGRPEGQDVAHHVTLEEKAGFAVYRFGGPLARAQTLDLDVGLGAVWVGTSLGLLRHDPKTGGFRLWDESAGLPGARLSDIAVVGGRVIADSSTPTTPGNVRGTGVVAFDVARLAWTTLEGVGGPWDLWGDGQTLWVGTGRGAEARDLDTGAALRFTREAGQLVHDSVHAVRRHGETVAFAAMGDYVKETQDFTGGGLTLWDRRANRFRHYTPNDGLARGYCSDVFLDDDDVFVAHWDEERGLSRIDRRTGRVEAWPKSANGVELGGVVLAGDRRTLWIGQQGALVRLDRATRQATALYEKDGLPGYIVSGVVVAADAVWASVYAYGSDGIRSAGLVRFRR